MIPDSTLAYRVLVIDDEPGMRSLMRRGLHLAGYDVETVENGEAWVLQMHIPPYDQGNRWNLEPTRRRKLLLHRAEIAKLEKAVTQKGQAIIPLKLYFARGRAKLLLGVGKGKKTHDKRHTIAERDANREIHRARRVGERGE